MSFLDSLKAFFEYRELRETLSLPGWRTPTRPMRKLRTPFSSSRKRDVADFRMHLEEFATREERNERFRQLRERGTRNLHRYTVSRAIGPGSTTGHIVWCLVRP